MALEKNEHHVTYLLPVTPSQNRRSSCCVSRSLCYCGIPSIPENASEGFSPQALTQAVSKAKTMRRTIDLAGLLPIPHIDCLLWRVLVLTEKLIKDLRDYCAFEGLLARYMEKYAIAVPWRSFRGREHKRDLEVLAHMQWNCSGLPDAENFLVDLKSAPWLMRLRVLRYLLAVSVHIVNSYDSGQDGFIDMLMAPSQRHPDPDLNRVMLGIKSERDLIENCPICFEEIRESSELSDAMYATTGCGHRFHQRCFGRWTVVAPHKDCPSCRTPLY